MITIILIEPKGLENVGSVARAMKNMGVNRLILVNPQCDYLSEKSSQFSVHAFDILQNAVIYPSLSEVKPQFDQLIAVTRRIGSWRIKDFSPRELPEYIADYAGQNIGLVFGREANGLTTDEIFLCDLICSIPSSEEFPSLNLSHAVMVILYELFQAKSLTKRQPLADSGGFKGMIDQIFSTLNQANFFKSAKPEIMKSYIRKILLRARLKSEDTRLIKRIFQILEGIIKNK